MATGWVDYRQVKEQVSMQMVLDHYQISDLKPVGDNLRGKCPIHQGEGTRAFNVSLSKNNFQCFSCKAKGNILDLVAALEKLSVREAALRLQELFLTGKEKGPTRERATEQKADSRIDILAKDKINPPLAFQLRIDPGHEYGPSRGLSKETIEYFGCGLCLSRGMFAGRYTIPLHNEKAELVGYAGRALGELEPRYLFPSSEKGFYKSYLLFNLHRVLTERAPGDPVIVVEGFFSVMKLKQEGYQAVGLLGSSVSKEQEELLARHFQKLILMFDNDEAGRKGIEDCLNTLARRVFVKVASLPEGKQPDTLSQQQLAFVLGEV
jgi:DNA primase